MKKLNVILVLIFTSIFSYSQTQQSLKENYESKQFKKAIIISDSLINKADTSFETFYYRGLSQLAMFKYKQSEQSFLKALGLTNDTLPIKYLLADIYEKSNKYKDAINVYNQILMLDTTDIQTLARLGKLNRADFNFSKASVCYSKLITIDSTNSYFYSLLAKCLENMNMLPFAGIYHLASYSYDTTNAQYAQNYLSNLMRMKFYDSAKVFIDTIMPKFPKNTYFIRNNAFLLTIKKDFLEGIKEFQRAVELGDSSLFTCKYYGQALFENKEYEKSIFWLERYLKVNINDLKNQMLISVAYRENYQFHKSLKFVNIVLSDIYDKEQITGSLKQKVSTNIRYADYLKTWDSLPQKQTDLYKESIDILKECQFLTPEDNSLNNSLASLYDGKLKDYKKALYYYELFYKNINDKDKFLKSYVETRMRQLKEELHFMD